MSVSLILFYTSFYYVISPTNEIFITNALNPWKPGKVKGHLFLSNDTIEITNMQGNEKGPPSLSESHKIVGKYID